MIIRPVIWENFWTLVKYYAIFIFINIGLTIAGTLRMPPTCSHYHKTDTWLSLSTRTMGNINMIVITLCGNATYPTRSARLLTWACCLCVTALCWRLHHIASKLQADLSQPLKDPPKLSDETFCDKHPSPISTPPYTGRPWSVVDTHVRGETKHLSQPHTWDIILNSQTGSTCTNVN